MQSGQRQQSKTGTVFCQIGSCRWGQKVQEQIRNEPRTTRRRRQLRKNGERRRMTGSRRVLIQD